MKKRLLVVCCVDVLAVMIYLVVCGAGVVGRCGRSPGEHDAQQQGDCDPPAQTGDELSCLFRTYHDPSLSLPLPAVLKKKMPLLALLPFEQATSRVCLSINPNPPLYYSSDYTPQVNLPRVVGR